MARNLNLDTTRQEFLKESFNKEIKLRNTWFQGYFGGNELPKHLSAKTSTSPLPASKAGPKLINIKPAPPSPINPIRTVPDLKDLDPTKKFAEMRSPSPETKNMVFSGLSAEGEGRKAYLIQRKLKSPTGKFLYPLTSAQEVGWDIKNVSERLERPAFFGKSKIVQETFFRKNGMDN